MTLYPVEEHAQRSSVMTQNELRDVLEAQKDQRLWLLSDGNANQVLYFDIESRSILTEKNYRKKIEVNQMKYVGGFIFCLFIGLANPSSWFMPTGLQPHPLITVLTFVACLALALPNARGFFQQRSVKTQISEMLQMQTDHLKASGYVFGDLFNALPED